MKLVAEYLANVQQFDRLAASEDDPDAKRALEQQAEAYFKLAVKRAAALGLPEPPRRPPPP
jgi:hypothetical protein